jgi:hypothetical protein
MRSNLSRLTVVFTVGMLAFLLTGCADQEARNDALDAKKTADTLKGEVAKLQQELANVKEQVGGIRTALEQKISEKMDAISKSTTTIEDAVRKDFNAQMAKNAEDYKALFKDADSRVDSRLKAFLDQDLATSFSAMRKDIETNRQELLGFMDKQLKELYPYAYQPKRLENAGPPTEPK